MNLSSTHDFLRTSGRLRSNGIRSLAIKLKRLIWKSWCIRAERNDGIITGCPFLPSFGFGSNALVFSSSKNKFRWELQLAYLIFTLVLTTTDVI